MSFVLLGLLIRGVWVAMCCSESAVSEVCLCFCVRGPLRYKEGGLLGASEGDKRWVCVCVCVCVCLCVYTSASVRDRQRARVLSCA